MSNVPLERLSQLSHQYVDEDGVCAAAEVPLRKLEDNDNLTMEESSRINAVGAEPLTVL